MSWYQVHIYNKSFLKLEDENTFIPPDELHWYKWLKQKKKKNHVSHYLHEKHKNRKKMLEKRRINRIIRKNENVHEGDNICRMSKEDLLFHAKERNVKIPKNIRTIAKQRKYVLNTLRG